MHPADFEYAEKNNTLPDGEGACFFKRTHKSPAANSSHPASVSLSRVPVGELAHNQ